MDWIAHPQKICWSPSPQHLWVWPYLELVFADIIKLGWGRTWDFPGGPVVKNLASSAGDASSIPGRVTKIPHAVGQLSPHATTTELVRLN